MNLTRTLEWVIILPSTQSSHTWLTGKVIILPYATPHQSAFTYRGNETLRSVCVFVCAMYIRSKLLLHTVQTCWSLRCVQVFINTSIILLRFLTGLLSIAVYTERLMGVVRDICTQSVLCTFLITTQCGETPASVLLQLVFGVIILVFIAIISICSLRMCMHQYLSLSFNDDCKKVLSKPCTDKLENSRADVWLPCVDGAFMNNYSRLMHRAK